MYILKFKKNGSKYFKDALSFAKELNCDFDGETVIIKIPEEHIFNAYSTFRTLFGIIQNWKGTSATFRGEKVHPYQFVLSTSRLFECETKSKENPKNCLVQSENISWGCFRIDNILYELNGSGDYKKNGKFWYNYGYFNGYKWVIDKETLLNKLLHHISKKGIDLCSIYDENKVRFAVDSLPDFIMPDNKEFKIHYIEKYVDGQKVQIPNNIRHVTRKTYSKQLLHN